MNKKICICVLGLPGSGKGTLSQQLAKQFGFSYIEMGALLRAKQNLRNEMNAGGLLSHEVVMDVFREELGRDASSAGIVLDGAPRVLGRKGLIEETLGEYGFEVGAVVVLGASPEVLLERVTKRTICNRCGKQFSLRGEVREVGQVCPIATCGGIVGQRPEDKPETFQKRCAVFNEETRPVIDAYRQEGKVLLIEVNSGGREKEEVFQEVQKQLQPFVGGDRGEGYAGFVLR